MKVAIVGSRNIKPFDLGKYLTMPITEIVSGGAFYLVIFFALQRVIFPFREVILKPCGFSDILFAINYRRQYHLNFSSNITAKQYHSPNGE